MIILVILIILLIFQLFIIYRSPKEFFEIESPNIIFLNKNLSCIYFKKYHTQYFSKFQPKESVARNCIQNENEFNSNTIIEKCKLFYCLNTLDFSNNEKKNIRYIISLIKKRIPTTFFNYIKGIKFIKVSKNIESELPHTIHDSIVLPQLFLNQIKTYIKKKNIYELNKYIACTIVHEYIHILQRFNYKLFKILYSQFWPFIKVRSNILNKYLNNSQRLNPDGIDQNWAFKLNSNELVLPYVNLKNKNLEFVDKFGLKLKIQNKNYIILDNKKLNYYDEFINYFCGINNNYHPNELSASLISEYFFNDYYKHNLNCQAYIQLKKWFHTVILKDYKNYINFPI